MKKYWKQINVNKKIIRNRMLQIFTVLVSILLAIFSFISLEDFNIIDYREKIVVLILGGIVNIVVSFILAILLLCIKKERTIWQNGKSKINVRYDDLLQMAFDTENKSKKIIVIPVNTHFDTKIDKEIGGVDFPLVTENTLHGKWILKMTNEECVQIEDLDQKIEASLRIQKIQGIEDSERARGKRMKYPRGTVAIIEGQNNVTFFLVALTEFDEKNNAQCNDDQYLKVIRNLIAIHNQKGQGYPMYMPLIGTNLSRTKYSLVEGLTRLESILMYDKNKINGEINIVIYTGDKQQVSIWNGWQN